MRLRYVALLLLLLPACANPTAPDADALYDALKDGEARFVVRVGDALFYPDDSRFRGEVTVAPDRLRINITDQHEGNVIITLDRQGLFRRKPVQQAIDIQNQTPGSVLIGRVRDPVKRTGDGFLMTDGTLTLNALSDDRVVLQLTGRTGNFNTIHEPASYQRLEGLLVYRKPVIHVPADQKKALLY